MPTKGMRIHIYICIICYIIIIDYVPLSEILYSSSTEIHQFILKCDCSPTFFFIQ